MTDTLFYDNGKIFVTSELTPDSILNGVTIRYFPNGNMNAKAEFKNGKVNGLATYYYESADVKKVSMYKNDYLHGETIEFYTSGNVKFERDYYFGKEVGTTREYFDSSDKKIKGTSEGVIVNGKVYTTTFTTYDEKGKIIETLPSLEINQLDDSLIVEVRHPKFNQAIALIADFDNYYNLKDSTTLDSIKADKNLILKIPFQRGDTIKGLVRNYELLDKKITIAKDIYFSHPKIWK